MRAVCGRLVWSGRLGLLPSPFNPPTNAHLALADRAQQTFGLDQVAFVLPRKLPHKQPGGPSCARRLRWLEALARGRADRAVLESNHALILDIATAVRSLTGPRCELFAIAGRDAAERYERWDYGDRTPFREQLELYTLLVASRNGRHRVTEDHRGRIFTFDIGERHAAASSSSVRERIRSGRPWSDLVPDAIRVEVGQAYAEPSP